MGRWRWPCRRGFGTTVEVYIYFVLFAKGFGLWDLGAGLTVVIVYMGVWQVFCNISSRNGILVAMPRPCCLAGLTCSLVWNNFTNANRIARCTMTNRLDCLNSCMWVGPLVIWLHQAWLEMSKWCGVEAWKSFAWCVLLPLKYIFPYKHSHTNICIYICVCV